MRQAWAVLYMCYFTLFHKMLTSYAHFLFLFDILLSVAAQHIHLHCKELYEFMKYSINNLGDPYITSNYGVHSRQFECSVIDFFADLWKMEKDSYWGYVTTCGK